MDQLDTTKVRWLISIILFSMITIITIPKSDKIFYPSPGFSVMHHCGSYTARSEIFSLSYNKPNAEKEFSVKK